MTSKQEWRTALLAKRMSVSRSELEKAQDLLLIRFQQLAWPFLELVHAYVPMVERNEPDPEPLVRSLQFQQPGVGLAVPKITGEKEMTHLLITDHTRWVTNRWGIPEPETGERLPEEAFDLVFIPLLGFDQHGNRIGYGKGYYDVFLARCRPDIIKVGLSFLPPLEHAFPVDPWDIPLDLCITPDQIYAFK